MTEIFFLIEIVFVTVVVFTATFFFVIFTLASLLKMRFVLRERHMKKLAGGFGFHWQSNQPSFKKCLLVGLYPYRSSKEDWKTNFMEGTIDGHKISIHDNLLIHFLPVYTRRTIVSVGGQELPGKELKTNFLKLQDGFLTSTWELNRMLKKIASKN